jgi:hypothetical protein
MCALIFCSDRAELDSREILSLVSAQPCLLVSLTEGDFSVPTDDGETCVCRNGDHSGCLSDLHTVTSLVKLDTRSDLQLWFNI